MGAKDSKPCCISYEEAIKRVSEGELKRLRDAFKRASNLNGIITKQSFIKDVLGDAVPIKLAEHIFQACGGTEKGINFKDLICGLVLLTRGQKDEKIKFIFSLYANESGTHVLKDEMVKLVQACDGGYISSSIAECFSESEKVTFEEFEVWLWKHGDATSLTKWLLTEPCSVSLSNKLETPSFYQTLAGVTHLNEADIIELEKRYWFLKQHSRSGKFDLETICPLISPPLPASLCDGFFYAFDENRDGHIDFKEMACGISACCKGPLVERQKFCFKVFDRDRDGQLSRAEVLGMIQLMLFVQKEFSCSTTQETSTAEEIFAEVFKNNGADLVTMGEYLVWSEGKTLPSDILNLLSQVCHIVFGLRPATKAEEGEIIRTWLEREEKRNFQVGQIWYVIASDWWKSWNDYIDCQGEFLCPSGSSSLKRSSKLQKRLNSSLALCPDDGVVLSSVVTLGEDALATLQNEPQQQLTVKNTFLEGPRTPGHSPGVTRKSALQLPQKPPSIDNSSLVMPNTLKAMVLTGEGGRLKRSAVIGRDFEIVPEGIWRALFQWYGGAPLLPRQVIPSCSGPELELFPVTLKLYRHQASPSRQPAWSGVVNSVASVYAGGTPTPYTSQIINIPKRYLAYLASFSRTTTLKQLFDFLCIRLRLRAEDTRLWLYKDENNIILIEDEHETLEQLGIEDNEQILIEVRNKDLTWPEELSSLLAARQDQKNQGPAEKGATGLNNLGNTCFMNSALQCVSNTRPLTLYFNSNRHLYELNRTNPLGMKGHIAKRYGDLVQELWSGTSRTVAPLKLRLTIGKYAPRFNGFQQHDSQELLAFLMDGLHEDLNRVPEKPYVELKDSNGRPDSEVAREAWENHVLRNRSIIVDLFHGQLQSTVTCEVCGHSSVRFDPFNYLSLPLPMESCIHAEVIVVRLDGSVPIKYGLRLNHDEKYGSMKQKLSQLCQLPPKQLLLTEVVGSHIRSLPGDEQKIRLLIGGFLFAYELGVESGTSEGNDSLPNGDAKRPATPPGSKEKMFQIGEFDTSAYSSQQNCDSLENPFPSNWSYTGSTASLISCSSASDIIERRNLVIAYHRKMIRQDVYFLSSQKSRPTLFGLPLALPCCDSTTHNELYRAVWTQVSRLVSPPPPSESSAPNHAQDCDDSLGYEYPFTLKAVQKDGLHCALCPWFKFCCGCRIECCDADYNYSTGYISIDWEPTALHLRYQASQEKEFVSHESVERTRQQQVEAINLYDCLEAFTREEQLAEEEKYHCSKCKRHQLATKKLCIWRLPPILIVHLKRFQLLNGRWVKSQKIVHFPFQGFHPTEYLATMPREAVLSGRAPVAINGDGLRVQDYHHHRLLDGHNPLDLKYNLYAIVCHSGILGGGHYVSYACNPTNRWYCYNDSSCKEVQLEQIDSDSAYMLFYEREGIDHESYMPEVGSGRLPDTREIDEEFETDFKKLCSLQ